MGRILVLAGVHGAGKSSLLGTWLEAEGLSWFTPDSFPRRLVEAGWPLPEANAEAWQEGTRRLRQAMADGTDFAFETTLGGNTIPRLLREACERHHVAICGAGGSRWPRHSGREDPRALRFRAREPAGPAAAPGRTACLRQQRPGRCRGQSGRPAVAVAGRGLG
ncbi:hypothetical protein G6F21_014039 [Rhizopus arrhizus]|nr:hypothetical protein G6F21_014039 [Rhizopus arrhizus]